jgi:putative Holliday junction resolvase
MGRLMGIDFGLKRTGLSVTDPLKIIVQGLTTCSTDKVLAFIKTYAIQENIEAFVVGTPFLEGSWGDRKFQQALKDFTDNLRKEFPEVELHLHDERFSSIRAREIISRSGLKKKKRESKELLDQTSAVVILQEYLGHI